MEQSGSFSKGHACFHRTSCVDKKYEQLFLKLFFKFIYSFKGEKKKSTALLAGMLLPVIPPSLGFSITLFTLIVRINCNF